MSLAKLLTTILSGIILLASIHFTNGTCPSGTTEGYAFCCCKKIFIENASLTVTIMPSTSIMPTASINLTSVNSTTIESTATTSYSLASTIVATSSLMNSINSTSTIEVSLLNTSATPALTSSVVATPTPIYRGDGCFITEQKYGYFNECYCNYTRYNYAGFNNSNGYYTKNPNSTSYNYKCWNLPKPKLHIGGLIETKQELGKKMLIAADLALEEINKNDLILPGYELVLLRQNSTEVSSSKRYTVYYPPLFPLVLPQPWTKNFNPPGGRLDGPFNNTGYFSNNRAKYLPICSSNCKNILSFVTFV